MSLPRSFECVGAALHPLIICKGESVVCVLDARRLDDILSSYRVPSPRAYAAVTGFLKTSLLATGSLDWKWSWDTTLGYITMAPKKSSNMLP